MTSRGTGRPLDKLDRLCKEYKECVNCALSQQTLNKQGDECDATDVSYTYPGGQDGCDAMPENGKKSKCKKAVCECDVMFATSKFRCIW